MVPIGEQGTFRVKNKQATFTGKESCIQRANISLPNMLTKAVFCSQKKTLYLTNIWKVNQFDYSRYSEPLKSFLIEKYFTSSQIFSDPSLNIVNLKFRQYNKETFVQILNVETFHKIEMVSRNYEQNNITLFPRKIFLKKTMKLFLAERPDGLYSREGVRIFECNRTSEWGQVLEVQVKLVDLEDLRALIDQRLKKLEDFEIETRSEVEFKEQRRVQREADNVQEVLNRISLHLSNILK